MKINRILGIKHIFKKGRHSNVSILLIKIENTQIKYDLEPFTLLSWKKKIGAFFRE